jgi:hypothetical protein
LGPSPAGSDWLTVPHEFNSVVAVATEFDRRGKPVEVSGQALPSGRRVATFRATGPRAAASSDWTAAPLPQIRRDSEGEVELQRIVYRTATAYPTTGLVLQIRPVRAGRGSSAGTRWIPAAAEVADGTGKVFYGRLDPPKSDGIRWTESLWRRERAWRIRIFLPSAGPVDLSETLACSVPGPSWSERSTPYFPSVTSHNNTGLSIQLEVPFQVEPAPLTVNGYPLVANSAAPGGLLRLEGATDDRGRAVPASRALRAGNGWGDPKG